MVSILNLLLLYISELDKGWKSAVLNTQEEYEFIIAGQQNFSNSLPYWLSGSCKFQPNAALNYSDYIADNSGRENANVTGWQWKTNTLQNFLTIYISNTN